jgi:hypothetical protein
MLRNKSICQPQPRSGFRLVGVHPYGFKRHQQMLQIVTTYMQTAAIAPNRAANSSHDRYATATTAVIWPRYGMRPTWTWAANLRKCLYIAPNITPHKVNRL